MRFSQTFRTSGWHCQLSTNGGFIASAHQHQLVVRRSETGEIVQSFTCDDAIEKIAWSPDSEYLLCALYKRCRVQIFSLTDCDWRCRVTEGTSGLIDALWCPDSRHILTIGEFYACVSIWSLVNCSVLYIHNLKSTASPALSFSPDGSYLAVIEDHGSTSKISFFDPTAWKLIKHVSCDDFLGVGGMSWSPNGSTLCLWDNKLHQCSVKLFCMETGSWIGQYKHNCLGAKVVAWSPSGQLLAIGCWDGTVLLLNYITWEPLVVIKHSNELSDSDCTIYRQPVDKEKTDISYSTEVVKYRPVTVIPLAWDKGGDSWKNRGVGVLNFSSCGSWLVTRDDSMPALAWVWDLNGCLVSAVIHNEPITGMIWDPQKACLLSTTNTSTITILNVTKGAKCMTVPNGSALGEVLVKRILCDPFGRYAVLVGRTRFVILYSK
ncbi:WD repeat-containing protein WRAP73-like isoform X1 [Schistocerca serialis cubense]|uniref:WD repeat-containing protein WRAP73-like isoform X1 n=1 Tax=Schistocerca serialis cubense TaxID=2023355 RepID=UPI00214E3638|nr:WD repeat-containing protein WRAP73-like isoform X1 [Schistocerca serialis cubense]